MTSKQRILVLEINQLGSHSKIFYYVIIALSFIISNENVSEKFERELLITILYFQKC